MEFNDFFVEQSLVDLNILECGREQCFNGKIVNHEVDQACTLHLIERGCGYIIVNDKRIRLSRGNVFAIFPKENISYEADADAPWTYSWVRFDGFQAEVLMKKTGLSREMPYKHYTDYHVLLEPMTTVINTYTSYGLFNLECLGWLYIFLGKLINLNTDKGSKVFSAKEKLVREVMIFLRFNRHNKLKISELAARHNVSASYLVRSFRQAMNMSPKEYLRWYQLQEAYNYLLSPDSTVEEAAKKSGYTDLKYFFRIFKKQFGFGPWEVKTLGQDEKKIETETEEIKIE